MSTKAKKKKKKDKSESSPPPPETHTFRLISDLHAIPLEKIEDFCKDLALWLATCRLTETIEGLKMTSSQDQFTWIDDGKHDVKINLTIYGEEKE